MRCRYGFWRLKGNDTKRRQFASNTEVLYHYAMKQTEQLLNILQQTSILRPNDLATYGISRLALYTLHRQGKVVRTGRGLYTLSTAELSEHHSLAEVCKRTPHGVICLLSALRFHNIGTQNPIEVWLAIDHKARQPKFAYPPMRIVRFSGPALIEGVEEFVIEGVTVCVYTIAKTIADCFKYRNKIGLDVCLEALRECRRTRRCTIDEIWHYAKICRVSNVILPYLEALT
jgi:predicted transcriptional regulator of viral defense system